MFFLLSSHGTSHLSAVTSPLYTDAYLIMSYKTIYHLDTETDVQLILMSWE